MSWDIWDRSGPPGYRWKLHARGEELVEVSLPKPRRPPAVYKAPPPKARKFPRVPKPPEVRNAWCKDELSTGSELRDVDVVVRRACDGVVARTEETQPNGVSPRGRARIIGQALSAVEDGIELVARVYRRRCMTVAHHTELARVMTLISTVTGAYPTKPWGPVVRASANRAIDDALYELNNLGTRLGARGIGER